MAPGREREQAETQARIAAQSGDAYDELIAESQQYISKDDWRRAARAAREAIALSPDMPNRVLQPRCSAQQLGVLRGGGAAVPWGQGALSGGLAGLGTGHYNGLQLADARGVRRGGQAGRGGTTRGSRRCRRGYLVREAPDDGVAHQMRANVLCGQCTTVLGRQGLAQRRSLRRRPRRTHYERAAALHPVPPRAAKALFAGRAGWCRRQAERPCRPYILYAICATMRARSLLCYVR